MKNDVVSYNSAFSKTRARIMMKNNRKFDRIYENQVLRGIMTEKYKPGDIVYIVSSVNSVI